MPSRFCISAIQSIQFVGVRTRLETGARSEFVDCRPNAALARGVVVHRGMKGRFREQPGRLRSPGRGCRFANRPQVRNVLLGRGLRDHVRFALLPKHGAEVAEGLTRLDQPLVERLARHPLRSRGPPDGYVRERNGNAEFLEESVSHGWPNRAAVAAIRHGLRIVGDRPGSLRRIEGHYAIGRIAHLEPLVVAVGGVGLPGNHEHLADAERFDGSRVSNDLAHSAANFEPIPSRQHAAREAIRFEPRPSHFEFSRWSEGYRTILPYRSLRGFKRLEANGNIRMADHCGHVGIEIDPLIDPVGLRFENLDVKRLGGATRIRCCEQNCEAEESAKHERLRLPRVPLRSGYEAVALPHRYNDGSLPIYSAKFST